MEDLRPGKRKRDRKRKSTNYDDELPHSTSAPPIEPSRVDPDKNPRVEYFSSIMQETVWVIRIPSSENDDSYDHYGGVCISADGLILTSSQVCDEKLSELVGRTINTKYMSLEVSFVDNKAGWGIVSLKKGREEKFQFACIGDQDVSIGLSVFCIGHPDSTKFCCLKGMITHACEFNCKEYKDDDAHLVKDSTYLDVSDVRDEEIEEMEKSPSRLDLSESGSCPVLSVEGFHNADGMTGSPVFDATGLVIGLIWFGDDTLIYGVPSKVICHGVSPSYLKKLVIIPKDEVNMSPEEEVKEEGEGPSMKMREDTEEKQHKKKKRKKKKNKSKGK